MSFTSDEMTQLYAPFQLSAHSIREGHKAGNKIRWFVYLDRAAIQRRLDELFPGEWEFIPGERTQTDTYISYTATLKIRGMSRGFNGGDAQDTRWDNGQKVMEFNENVEKGAMTDTFRRCASMWGLGIYLNDSVDIYTDGYERGDWDAKHKCESDAKRQFETWYRGNCGILLSENGQQNSKPVVTNDKPATPKNAAKQALPAWWNEVLPVIKNMPHFGNSTHAANALNKMLTEGQLTPEMTAAVVIQAVKTKYEQTNAPKTDAEQFADDYHLNVEDSTAGDVPF